jgi:hypothetical protein
VTLRNDKNFVILSAVKGNASVVMLDQDYLNRMRSILIDPVYGQLITRPTNQTQRNTICLTRKSRIPEDTAMNLSPHGSVSLRIYSVPKTYTVDIHSGL